MNNFYPLTILPENTLAKAYEANLSILGFNYFSSMQSGVTLIILAINITNGPLGSQFSIDL